jgi:hypothetical protein
MKWKFAASLVVMLQSLFGWEKIPLDAKAENVEFSEDERLKMEKTLGAEEVKKMIALLNKDLKAMKDSQENLELKAQVDSVKAKIKEVAQELEMSEADLEKALNATGDNSLAGIELLQKEIKTLKSTVEKLINEDAPDMSTIIRNLNPSKIEHSATHLFATGKDWDAFEKRPWNARLRDGGIQATNFNTGSHIPLLQDDLEHFVRENPNALNSLFDDFEDLPAEWDRRSGVLDRVADGYVIPAEVVQGRKKGWQPKNDFFIDSEEGRVFRKKIDITFNGYELQEIENTWIRMYNNVGSHPWKMSFIGFLMTELVKQQKLDDRKAQINGIFAETLDTNQPGKAVNSQNGLRYLFWYYRDVKKQYRPFVSSFGEPTKANIVEYVKEMIESIPEEHRNAEMELGLSTEMLRWYRETAGIEYQLHKSQDEGMKVYSKAYPIDYPNIKFQPLKDMTKTKFMYITRSKNIQIMDYNVDEKGKFTITHEKRDTHIFADYRLGIRLKFVGTKTLPGDPKEFEKQLVWSNDVPVFDKDTKVPIFDNKSGIVKFTYANMQVDEVWNTDIAAFENFPKGIVVKITGDVNLSNVKNVKNNANILLTGDFNLKTGGTLTLFVQEDGKLRELRRTPGPETISSTDVTYSTATIDANEGNVFVKEGADALTINSIVNGVEGKVIIIKGGTGDVTIATVTGVILMTSNAVLASANDYVELMKIDGVWTEIKRVIA